MTIVNSYITRTNFLNWLDTKTATSAADDLIIDDIIESASRYIDDTCGRRFFPYRQARVYDKPEENQLELIADLLDIYSVTNGDLVGITAADYILLPANDPPYWAIKLRDTSSMVWEPNAAGSDDQVITVDGLWSYRPFYPVQGWTQVGTLAADIANTTVLTATLTAGHTAITGQIWKVGIEIFQGSVAANIITVVSRGDNGTTAAVHTALDPIYMWNVYKPIQSACYQIVTGVYKRRFGENLSGVARVTGAGVVITPQDVPQLAMRTLLNLSRLS
jgi:hypothetical protein